MRIKLIFIMLFFMIKASYAGESINNPILFVTQFPIASDFTTIGSTFGNHSGEISVTGRGGDLYIRYSDGSLRNLTREAGFGNAGFQGNNSIAVRDPTVHWSATKALFSMVVGAPPVIFGERNYYWQMYEITGIGQGQTVQITRLNNQPENYNNITPIYGSDDSIIFTTDMPRTKNRFNYPQKDEYESAPTNTGLWKLNPETGEVSLLQHSPSGSFSPLIDSAGRLVFTRWDHLQRDQQASPNNNIEAFNYVSEPSDASAPRVNNVLEVFPEPRPAEEDLLAGTNLNGHRLNHFFPWEINQDGTEEETLNHVGRHELHSYFDRSMNDDVNLDEFIPGISRPNANSILNTFMLHEDPNQNGRFVAIEAQEFGTHNGGQIIAFSLPNGNIRPDLVTVDYITHESTRNTNDNPVPEHIGFSRDPITLSNGTLIASHTSETRENENEGTRENPLPRYDFRIKTFNNNGSGDYAPESLIANLSNVDVSFFDPDVLVSYTGPMWELQPVEVVVRPPPMTHSEIQPPEEDVFAEENVDSDYFKSFLKANNLAVLVMRDVTTRDVLDTQQPYNLKVAGQPHQTTGSSGQIYDISHMQFFQGDQIRGSGGVDSPDSGQRVIAQYLHDIQSMANNIPFEDAPLGSTEVYPDGSVAAFVPARRAMSWQTLDPQGTPVVRERYWITFQPGEIRVCGGCHGVNDVDQSGAGPSEIKAEALRELLQNWKNNFPDLIFDNGFEM